MVDGQSIFGQNGLWGQFFGSFWAFMVIVIIVMSFILYKYGASFKDMLMFYYFAFAFVIVYNLFGIPAVWLQVVIILIFFVVSYYVYKLIARV